MTESCRLITTEQYQEYQLLKEQIEEANRIMQVSIAWSDKHTRDMIHKYLKKWSVK